MGTFSWMFADEENRHNLQIGHRGYLALPDGNFLYERGYAGYGIFDGQDVYELVVHWNREYIAASPNAEVPCGSKRHGVFIAKRFRDYWWYPVIADLTLSREEIVQKLQALNPDSYHDLRGVGINIARCRSQSKSPELRALNTGSCLPARLTSRKAAAALDSNPNHITSN